MAQCLAADTTTRAGIVLVRALRNLADHLGVGIAAVARNEHLLDDYHANGFVPTNPDDPASRLLYRPPTLHATLCHGKGGGSAAANFTNPEPGRTRSEATNKKVRVLHRSLELLVSRAPLVPRLLAWHAVGYLRRCSTAGALTISVGGAVQLLLGEREGRIRAPVGGLPAGVLAVTVPVRRDGEARLPRDRSRRLRIEDVDLISDGPTSSYAPPPTLTSRELIFALEAGRRDWSTVVEYFGDDRAWDVAVSLVHCGGIVLRCSTDDDLHLGSPISWRRSHSWSLQHADLLHDLRGRPDPDALRAELIHLMEPVPELASERAKLASCPVGSPLRVPADTATGTVAWSVYENAIRAAVVWLRHHATGGEKLTANDLAGRAFRNSKAWTPERQIAFSNLVGMSFDQAVEQADTDLRLRGPLEWCIGSVAADANITEPWIGLPARGLHAAGDLRCTAVGVLLIENADSFEQVCKVTGVAKNWLCIWGKGYTSHGIIALLTHFTSLPIAAWFDLDADGIKIIDVLERKLQRRVQPVGMDLELWQSTPHRIQTPKQIDRDKELAEGLAKSGPLALRPLAHEIALYGGSCEQQPIHQQVLPKLAGILNDLLHQGTDG